MYKYSTKIGVDGQGAFALELGAKTLGKIKIKLIDGELALLDTIVPINSNLKSVGVLLIREIVDYARMHELKIVTISKFVQKQFSNNPELYADVWEKL